MLDRTRRQLWAAGLGAHFFAIVAISAWDIANLVADRRTFLPQPIVPVASTVTRALKSGSPRRLRSTNPVRQTLIGYCHAAGIESPYSFFAPNVPKSLRVIFEIYSPDKRVSYE